MRGFHPVMLACEGGIDSTVQRREACSNGSCLAKICAFGIIVSHFRNE